MMMMKSLLLLFSLALTLCNGFVPQHSSPRPSTVTTIQQASIEQDVSYSEYSRRFRRSYFTHDDWFRHRSDDRFLRTLGTIATSGVVRQLANKVGVVVGVTTSVVVYNALFSSFGYTDFAGVHHDPLIELPKLVLPLEPFSVSGASLSLLLVFRTNASYSRWDQARKALGVIVNSSRNLVRMAGAWTTEECEPDPEKRRAAIKLATDRTWAFARSLQRHLLGEVEDESDYRRDLYERTPDIAPQLIAARHKPTIAATELGKAINDLPMPYLRRLEIDKSVIAFCDAMGACDRIFTSPVPLVYTRHTARFLGLFMLSLPFAQYPFFKDSWNHWAEIPTLAVVSFFLFGIEELSIQLEEPFSILPIGTIVGGIGKSADEAVQWHFEDPPTNQPK